MSKENYIDGKELKKELHKFSLSYRKEVKERYQEKIQHVTIVELDEYCQDELEKKLKKNKKEELKTGNVIEFDEALFLRQKTREYKMKFYKEAYKESNGVISDELGEMFMKLAHNLSCKKNWIGYTYRDEMVGKGLYFLCKYAHGFKINHKKANAFAYVTQICKNGFIQVWEKEEQQSKYKDKLIKDSINKTELDKWLEEDVFE